MANESATVQVPLVAPLHRHGSGWWGMMMLIATEAALFVYLLFSYYYIAAQIPSGWPPGGPLDIKLSLINTVILLTSSATMIRTDLALARRRNPVPWLIVTILLGAVFVGIQIAEWSTKTFTMSSDSFGSLYYIITCFHMAHVVVGLAMLAIVLTWVWRVRGRPQALAIRLVGFYWHFVDVVWLAVFFSFFVFPHLI